MKKSNSGNWFHNSKNFVISALILFFFIPFLFNFLIWIGNYLFQITQCNLLNMAMISNSDWFSFWGTYGTAIGTILLAIFALQKTNEANEINKKLVDLSKQALDNNSKLLQIEIEKKKPILFIDNHKEITFEFFPRKNGLPVSREIPFIDGASTVDDKILYILSKQRDNQASDIIVTIDFRLINKTVNLIKSVEIIDISLDFISNVRLSTKFFLKAQPIINVKNIENYRDISIWIIDDEETRFEIGKIMKIDGLITVFIEINMQIQNIYNEIFQNPLTGIYQMQHTQDSNMLTGKLKDMM